MLVFQRRGGLLRVTEERPKVGARAQQNGTAWRLGRRHGQGDLQRTRREVLFFISPVSFRDERYTFSAKQGVVGPQ